MGGARNYSEDEIALVRKSFAGRYALRDRCYFEMSLQLGLRVSEMLSITVGQVYQHGAVVDEISIERRHMKGGKATKEKPRPASHEETCPCNLCKPKRTGPTASGRVLPIFPESKPYMLAWLQRMAEMLHCHTLAAGNPIQSIDPSTPLFCSRVRNKDGSRRAIARETAWRIVRAIAIENAMPGKISCHSSRKTLAQRSYDFAKASGIEDPLAFTQKILGHRSISSTQCYVKSLTERAAWDSYRKGFAGKAA